MTGEGLLIAVSAPSGAGKTSLVRALAERDAQLRVSVSHTTRPRRATEQDGVNYHFIGTRRFQRMIEEGDFLEHAEVFGHHYGTALATVQGQRAAGHDVILEIDWQGAAQVRGALPDTIGIFLAPPSMDALRQRLITRGEDSSATITRRLREARAEMSHYDEFDYLVVNDAFDTALRDLLAIIRAERLRCGLRGGRERGLMKSLIRE